MFEVRNDFGKQRVLKILEVMTLLAVACLTVSKFGGYYLIITTIGKYSTLLEKIAFTLFLMKIMLTKYTKKEFLIILLISILGYFNYENSRNTEFLMSLAMVFSLKNVNLKKVFQVCFFSVLCMIVILGALSVFKITGELYITKNFGRVGVEKRYCFGFYHPNQWAHAVFMLLLFGTLAFWEHLNWKTAALTAGVNMAAYYFAASRTGMVCGTVLVLVTLMYKYGGRFVKGKKINYLITAACAAVWPVAVFLVSKAEGSFVEKLDVIFTGRIRMGREYMLVYNPTIWGGQIADQLENGSVLDFGYIRFLLEKGMLIYILLMLLTILLCLYAAKTEKYEIMVAVVCVTLYGIYENIAITVTPANVIMIYLAVLLFKTNFSTWSKECFID